MCKSNWRQFDPVHQCDGQKPAVPSCVAKEVLQDWKQNSLLIPLKKTLPSQYALAQIHNKEVEPGVIMWPEVKPGMKPLLHHCRESRGKWREPRVGFKSQEALVLWGSGEMDRKVMWLRN